MTVKTSAKAEKTDIVTEVGVITAEVVHVTEDHGQGPVIDPDLARVGGIVRGVIAVVGIDLHEGIVSIVIATGIVIGTGIEIAIMIGIAGIIGTRIVNVIDEKELQRAMMKQEMCLPTTQLWCVALLSILPRPTSATTSTTAASWPRTSV